MKKKLTLMLGDLLMRRLFLSLVLVGALGNHRVHGSLEGALTGLSRQLDTIDSVLETLLLKNENLKLIKENFFLYIKEIDSARKSISKLESQKNLAVLYSEVLSLVGRLMVNKMLNNAQESALRSIFFEFKKDYTLPDLTGLSDEAVSEVFLSLIPEKEPAFYKVLTKIDGFLKTIV